MDTPEPFSRDKRALFCLVVIAIAGCVYDIFYSDWDFYAAKFRLLDAGQISEVKVGRLIGTIYRTFGTWGVVVFEFVIRALLIVLTTAGIIGLGILTFAPKAFLARHTRGKMQDAPMPTVFSVVGEIAKITADSIQIKDQLGQIEAFGMTADAEYGTKSKPSRQGNFKSGGNVAVYYVERGGEKIATAICEHTNGIV